MAVCLLLAYQAPSHLRTLGRLAFIVVVDTFVAYRSSLNVKSHMLRPPSDLLNGRRLVDAVFAVKFFFNPHQMLEVVNLMVADC